MLPWLTRRLTKLIKVQAAKWKIELRVCKATSPHLKRNNYYRKIETIYITQILATYAQIYSLNKVYRTIIQLTINQSLRQG
jgi:hypothetical protein